MNQSEYIEKAVSIVGLEPLAEACDVSRQAIRKWQRNGMPRTEWSGETDYCGIIEKETKGAVTRAHLLKQKRKPAAA